MKKTIFFLELKNENSSVACSKPELLFSFYCSKTRNLDLDSFFLNFSRMISKNRGEVLIFGEVILYLRF